MGSAPAGVRGDESSLVARLTLEQKIRLLTGADSWSLHDEPAIGLRSMLLSDGPAGVRGTHFDHDNPSTSLPCPVALAATWDESLVERLTLALGQEARAKGVDVLLGPTVNIIRTPLSGRGFECFSEDPLLTTRIAVAYVRGVQAAGVGATAKHYVANDSETDRRTYDARIAEGVLRELYLPPFEACVGEADVFLVMAAYNSVNGASMTANAALLRDLLKTEWGFNGVVVSDWSATTSTVQSANAGLDLVMPGPGGPWGERLLAAVRNGSVAEQIVNDKVSRLLGLARRVGGFSPVASNGAGPRALVDPVLLRDVTARSFVLLSNHDGALPLDKGKLRKVALIGPNALDPQTQGGGSVQVLPSAPTDLAESLRAAVGDGVHLSVHQGCLTSTTIVPPRRGTVTDPVTGKPGIRLEIRTANGDVIHDAPFAGSAPSWWDGLPAAVHQTGSLIVIRARYRAQVDGPHVIGAAGVGEVRIAVDGVTLAEATSLQPRDIVEALSRPPELRVPVELRAGGEIEVRVECRPGHRFVTLRLGIAPLRDDDRLIAEAVEAARDADVAIVVVGSAEGTESEGYDRETLRLPGRQDELVQRVAAANANTVVVVNSGMPVLMPWAADVAAVIQAWLPGQAFGDALADTLLGITEPGGRLPVSMPRAEADSPVLRAHPEAGDLVYAEGLLVGYRGYDRSAREPLFPFGHGLGFTEWSYESLVAEEWVAEDDGLDVAVTVRNTGSRAGREVVQLYLEGPADDLSRPIRVLAAFASVSAQPGQVATAQLTVPARAFTRFDERSREWTSHRGTYALRAGRSSRDLRLAGHVVLR
jgi:beta-glucosidase